MVLTRRVFLAGVAALAAPGLGAENGLSQMGVAIASYAARWGARVNTARHPRWKDALDVLEHCHAIGAGGLQIGVREWAGDFAAKVRGRREALGLYLEGQVSLPREEKDVERFAADLRGAREAGITVLRTAAGNRRYEDFDSAEGFARFKEGAWRSLTLCEPVLKRHDVVLAVENHKDWRVADLLEMLKRLGSERVGVTLDTGNSIALLEDPMEVVEALAPHALSVHIKDMGVREYEEGFLLSEVPLGEGFLDLPRIIETCRRHHPKVRFNLEMITRDPLRVPCMSEKYWATMGEVRGRELARAMGMVRKCSSKALPKTSGLSDDERVALEDELIRRSFVFAKEKLKL
jgi:sugar phosphate isomerase/epimerase